MTKKHFTLDEVVSAFSLGFVVGMVVIAVAVALMI